MKWPFRKGDDDQPTWDHARAEELKGCTVLVGLTLNEPTGQRQEQFYGTVMSADPSEGIILRLEGSRTGEMYTLAPALDAVFPAPKGSYTMRETGEVVIDPDYTTTWEFTSPRN